MRTTYEPLTAKQGAELRGYVSWLVRLVRAVLFLGSILLVAASMRSIHSSFVSQDNFFSNPVWWIAPAVVFAVWFYSRWKRWTGGRHGVAQIRADLDRGEAAIHHVEVIDAIEIEELEDEGPSYFILTNEKEVLYLSGQWLDGEKRKGFPWKTFEIVEAPASKTFFRLKKTGDRLQPSHVRRALDWNTLKRFKSFTSHYRILDVDFESLKTDPIPTPSQKPIASP